MSVNHIPVSTQFNIYTTKLEYQVGQETFQRTRSFRSKTQAIEDVKDGLANLFCVSVTVFDSHGHSKFFAHSLSQQEREIRKFIEDEGFETSAERLTRQQAWDGLRVDVKAAILSRYAKGYTDKEMRDVTTVYEELGHLPDEWATTGHQAAADRLRAILRKERGT